MSARSNYSLWTKGASTAGCVYVKVTRRHLTIKCHWFLDWLINGMGLDLNHVIPLTRVLSVKKTDKPHLIYKDTVFLEYRDDAGQRQSLELYMNKADEFLSSITPIANPT